MLPNRTVRLPATDQQRSVLSVMDTSTPRHCAYTPYGYRPLGNGLFSQLGFNGEPMDLVTGNYHLGKGYRPFNPLLMRFIRPDGWSPFGRGGLNAYAYCAGDPVNASDPTGHFISKLLNLASNLNDALKTTIAASSHSTDVSRGFKGLVNDMFTTTQHAFTRNPNPPPLMSPPRQHLKNVIDGIPDRAPYAEKLGAINKNLASNGNSALSMEQAQAYGTLAQNASAGRISNTTAHLTGSIYWAQKFLKDRQPDSIMGALLNFFGAVLSGTGDAKVIKTGNELRRNSLFLRRGSHAR